MIYFSRAEWNARHGRGPLLRHPLDLAIIHHFWKPHVPVGATDAEEWDAIAGVERYHAVTKGWDGIGYNFVITLRGHVYEGRGWGRSGAHTIGENSRSVGICFAMDGDTHPLTDAAVDACRDLLAQGLTGGHLVRGFRLAGHRDFAPKSCPGNLVYPRLPELHPEDNPPPPVVGYGDTGPAVRLVQEVVGVAADGIFGPATQTAVTRWQIDHSLEADGIVGPETWKAIDQHRRKAA